MAPVLKKRDPAAERVTKDDVWAVWPDTYMCPIEEVETMLRPPCARSDDFQRVLVLEYGEDDMPMRWEPYA